MGKDNYRIISIGTSPSSITEAIEHLGADVIYLPSTKAKAIIYFKDMLPKDKIDITNFKNTKLLLEYLKHKGINDNKTNILLDFTYTGASIQITERLIKENLDIRKEKIKSYSIENIMKNAQEFANKSGIKCNISDKTISKLVSDMKCQTSEYISNTPHFLMNESFEKDYKGSNYIKAKGLTKQELFKAFENYSAYKARAFSLCTFNELNKIGALES